jgi:hypothetical protein
MVPKNHGQEETDTSAQKLAHDSAIVLPKKPSEGFPRSPILEKTLLQTTGVSIPALQAAGPKAS